MLTPEQARMVTDFLLGTEKPTCVELPNTIGAYRIRRVIARGGMGTVYEAEQSSPQRRVALKVIKSGLASESALRRFEYEAQILARLEHPGIAHIYEAGNDEGGSGGPYFAMEYISAANSITQHAAKQKLDYRTKLKLFLEVCAAVQYGHSKGILHRDLKPSNILVGASGHLKIIDFGIARATDGDLALTSLHTQVGQLVGTLQYMSPEQCTGDPHDLDPRTDVYSLGVILYELVCGKLPYDLTHTAIPTAARIIHEQDPVRPSLISRTFRGDLETILLKSLEKDPNKRYSSVTELEQDIRRFLNGEPIEAHQATAWTKSVRWLYRHPILAGRAVSILIVATTLIATSLAVYYYCRVPFDVTVDANRNVHLLSRGKFLLHEWNGKRTDGFTDAIRCHVLLKRPPAIGGSVVVLGFHRLAEAPYAGSLCGFSADDPNQPIWRVGISADDIQESPLRPGFPPEQFGVGWAGAMDVFPRVPGEEIVAIFETGPSSERAVRVYDLDGGLLYDFWHDGSLADRPYWLAHKSLLIFCGFNSEAPWSRRDISGIQAPHAIVLFAVSPTLGRRNRGWIPHNGEARWYRCILPAEESATFTNPSVRPPHALEDASRFFRFNLNFWEDLYLGISLLVDEMGQEHRDGRRNNAALEARGTNHTEFGLELLPPIVE